MMRGIFVFSILISGITLSAQDNVNKGNSGSSNSVEVSVNAEAVNPFVNQITTGPKTIQVVGNDNQPQPVEITTQDDSTLGPLPSPVPKVEEKVDLDGPQPSGSDLKVNPGIIEESPTKLKPQ